MKKILLAALAFTLCCYSCETPANDDETPDNGDDVGNVNENGTVGGLNSGKLSAVWDGSFDISWYDANATLLLISTPEQLAGMVELVKSGTLFYQKTVVLQNNILLNGKIEIDENDKVTNSDELRAWEGIGVKNNSKTAFQGIFDGKGHYISGIYGNSLFNYCDAVTTNTAYDPQIRNLGIVNSYITEGNAAICSYACGGILISKCYNMGVVTGTGYIGGIIGKMVNGRNGDSSTIEYCFNAGKLISPYKDSTAGMAGDAYKGGQYESTKISGCYSTTPCSYDMVNTNYYSKEDMPTVKNCYVLAGSVTKNTLKSSGFNNDGMVTDGTNKGKTLLECLNEDGVNWIVKEGVNNGFPILKY